MNLVNLTPHVVTLVTPEGELTIPPSGTLARVAEVATPRGVITVDGVEIPIVAKRFGQIENLPEPQPDTIFIVSALVAQAAWSMGRTDVACPGDPVRNDAGQVIGARSLCVAPS